MRPEHLLRAKKLAIALLTSYKFKNKVRTIQPQFFKKIKSSQPELKKFTGSYKKSAGFNGINVERGFRLTSVSFQIFWLSQLAL